MDALVHAPRAGCDIPRDEAAAIGVDGGPARKVMRAPVHHALSMVSSAPRSSTGSLSGCIGSAPTPIISLRRSGTALTLPPVSEKKAVASPG